MRLIDRISEFTDVSPANMNQERPVFKTKNRLFFRSKNSFKNTESFSEKSLSILSKKLPVCDSIRSQLNLVSRKTADIDALVSRFENTPKVTSQNEMIRKYEFCVADGFRIAQICKSKISFEMDRIPEYPV